MNREASVGLITPFDTPAARATQGERPHTQLASPPFVLSSAVSCAYRSMSGVATAVYRMNRLRIPLSAITLTLAVTGCGALGPKDGERPTFYSLDAVQYEAAKPSEPDSTASRRPTIIVNPTHAAAGYDSRHILYVRKTHQLEYFAHSEWIDTPARMLTPLIVAAIEQSGGYQAVVLTPSAAVAELKLDTEIVRLQYEFDRQPSRVHFTLRAYIVDTKSRQVLGWREFDESVELESESPYSVVVASNHAVHNALEKLTVFVDAEAAKWMNKTP